MGNLSLSLSTFHNVHDTTFHFISDTQTFCDYFNFKSLYKIWYELWYIALEFSNVHTQIIQPITKPQDNDKENVLLIHLKLTSTFDSLLWRNCF